MGRDIQPTAWHDLRAANEGEACTNCGGVLRIAKALEIGHVFKLGTRYSETMNASVLTAESERVPIVMGSYGIGVERLMAAIVELHHDDKGISWPASVAPYAAVITVTNIGDESIRSAGEQIYEQCCAAGVSVVLDDRNERAGVKFNDADLVGFPYRITVGKKVKDGLVELYDRALKSAREIPITAVVAELTGLSQ